MIVFYLSDGEGCSVMRLQDVLDNIADAYSYTDPAEGARLTDMISAALREHSFIQATLESYRVTIIDAAFILRLTQDAMADLAPKGPR